jgi:GNAT superfamily N-acetyltransferase
LLRTQRRGRGNLVVDQRYARQPPGLAQEVDAIPDLLLGPGWAHVPLGLVRGRGYAQVRQEPQDVVLATEWAAAEGWNPGHADSACFATVDSQGLLLGALDGKAATSISVVNYDAGFAFLGFYIVRPDLRGRGFGLRTWNAAIAHAGQRTIGLDGVAAQQENYKKSDFVLAHRNIRFGGVPRFKLARDPRLTVVHSGLEPAIIKYDQAFFAAARNTFLRCWLRPEQRKGIALVENGNIGGYGVIRACRIGFKIGPLFADTDAGADLLFRALAATLKCLQIGSGLMEH